MTDTNLGAAAGDIFAKAFTLGYETGRKSALFPATEPAEVTGQDFLDAMPTEPDCWDVCEGHPAPAEPAEEETKAEDYCCHPMCRHTNWGGSNRKHTRGSDCPIVPKPSSSPVVPAPTETEWQTVDEIPEGVTRVKDCEGDIWELGESWVLQDNTPMRLDTYHPFVAAEEG